ncbi:MAG TPA: hypothetical protein VJ735_22575 [Actinomycetes bacterium]|nr:hypothetical protein [Actinomycetes bacterium]
MTARPGPDLAARDAFTAGATTYRWADVLISAHLLGDWPVLEARARAGLIVEAGGGRAAPETESLANAWRYERDLLTADDLEAWLRARGLGLGDWAVYLRRTALRVGASGSGSVDAGRLADVGASGSGSVDAGRLADAVVLEGICSGTFTTWADRLAGQAALHERVREELGTSPPWCTDPAPAGIDEAAPGLGPGGLVGVPADVYRERAELVACVRASAHRCIDELTGPAELERVVRSRRLEWTRVDLLVAVVDDLEAARELLLLVRVDGVAVEEAARLAGASVEARSSYLDEAGDGLVHLLTGAGPGDLLGPVAQDGGHLVVQVTARVEPSIDQPAVADRASGLIVQRALAREVRDRVRWHERI